MYCSADHNMTHGRFFLDSTRRAAVRPVSLGTSRYIDFAGHVSRAFFSLH